MSTVGSLARSFTGVALSLFALALLSAPAAAHGGAPDEHGHLLPVAVFLVSATVLGASLVADHFDVVDRSMADVGVVAGGVGIVLSVGLLWL